MFNQILSFVTESISILCLFITMVVLIKLRRIIDSERTAVQINLCLALFFLHLALLLQDFAVMNDRACELVTVTIHYFLLASGRLLYELVELFLMKIALELSFWRKVVSKV